MIETKLNEIRETIQRVLDCTLWGHIPGESMNIIREKSFKRKIEICEELLRQKLKLKKQMEKIDCAYNITLREILQDRNSATDQNGKRFRSPDVCVNARYKLTKDFVDHILINIKDCKMDPDTITDIALDIPYVIDYNNPYEYMEITKINDVRDALSDLWFVSSIQPVYDKGEISQFICRCNLAVNNSEEQEENTDLNEGKESIPEKEKESFTNSHDPDLNPREVEEYSQTVNQLQLKDALNEFISITIQGKQYFDAIKKLFSHDHYYDGDELIRLNIKVKEVSNAFLDQIIAAINIGKINKNTKRFSTVVEYKLSENMGETKEENYSAIVAAFKDLWFVKFVYPHYNQSIMLVCEIQIHDENNELIDGNYRNLAVKLSNRLYNFCKSIQFKIKKR